MLHSILHSVSPALFLYSLTRAWKRKEHSCIINKPSISQSLSHSFVQCGLRQSRQLMSLAILSEQMYYVQNYIIHRLKSLLDISFFLIYMKMNSYI